MDPIGVYIHFPWCARKCPYCDFATEPRQAPEIPHEGYAEAILRELAMRAGGLEDRPLKSVFFGGGTPSMWAPSELGRVLRAICAAFGHDDPRDLEEIEITVESNPDSLNADWIGAVREQGVNRLSIGVQSVNDDRLQFLGRLHDAKTALAAIETARSLMPRVSADLMFGMPDQSADDLETEIQTLLDLGLDHVSAYALTVEPATPFGERHRAGQLPLASDESYASMFRRAEEVFTNAGLEHYEVSNYARPGQESSHNQHYWQGGDYLGLGAAAVGCLADEEDPRLARRYRNHPKPERYMERAQGPEVEVFGEGLDPETRVREALMLGLRTREGVDLRALWDRTGANPLAPRQEAVTRRIEQGHVLLEDGHLRIPVERWLMLDGIVTDLF